MKNIVNKRGLFCDGYRALGLCEFQKEATIIRQLIKIAAEAVSNHTPSDPWGYDGICHMFAKSIVDYLKMAYDNLLLGHNYATQMIFRTVVENSVCLSVIQQYKEHELWKYYLIQSFYNSFKMAGSKLNTQREQDFKELCQEYGIEEEFLIKSIKKGSKEPFAYIDKNYGWTYKVNDKFNFSSLCKLVNQREYSDFQLMSMYSHGTSIYLKVCGFASLDHIMNTLSFFYYNINKLVSTYCPDSVPPKFYRLIEDLEDIFDEYIKEFE